MNEFPLYLSVRGWVRSSSLLAPFGYSCSWTPPAHPSVARKEGNTYHLRHAVSRRRQPEVREVAWDGMG